MTDRVTPTLDLARGFLERYVLPTGRLAAEFFGRDHPHLYGLIRRFARKRIRKIDDVVTLTDSAEFKRIKRYLFMLFKVPG